MNEDYRSPEPKPDPKGFGWAVFLLCAALWFLYEVGQWLGWVA